MAGEVLILKPCSSSCTLHAHTEQKDRALQILKFIVKWYFGGYRDTQRLHLEPSLLRPWLLQWSRTERPLAITDEQPLVMNQPDQICPNYEELFPQLSGPCSQRHPPPACGRVSTASSAGGREGGGAALTKDGGPGRPGSSVALKPFPPAPAVT